MSHVHVQVKPHPDLDPQAWPLLKHPASGGLLDAAGDVPADGRPWLNDGFTARLLTDGTLIRGDHPAFARKDKDPEAAKPSEKPADPPKPAAKPDAAH